MNPALPAEIEQQLADAIAANDVMPDVLKDINERRYAAERAYKRARAEVYAANRVAGVAPMDARARAEIEAADKLDAWHQAKTEFHYAQDTAAALRTSISGLQSLLKTSTAAMSLGVGRFGG